MKKLLLIVLLLVITAFISVVSTIYLTDTSGTPSSYDTYHISSKILSEEREIIVRVPAVYDKENHEQYPVIYVFGGNSLTYSISKDLDLLNRTGYTKPAIVVGISNVSQETRQRDLTPPFLKQDLDDHDSPLGQADKYLKYIQSEVIPLIEQNYKTTSEKVAVGHSREGLLVMYSLLSKPDLFSSRLALSPALWREENAFVKEFKIFLSTKNIPKTKLFLTMGDLEVDKMKNAFDQTVNLLEKDTSQIKWKSLYTKRANHQTNSFLSAPIGINWLLRDFNDDLQIVDISQKQLSLYNQHMNTDSTLRVKIFRDSLYYPYQEIWDGYLGSMETFDAVAEHYGIRVLDRLNDKNKIFYSDKKSKDLINSFYEIREGLTQLTGYSPKGNWYLLYGPGVVNLGSVGKGVMFVDFNFPGNTDLPTVINWLPHELNHLLYDVNTDSTSNALEICINEGFSVYVNKLYWNTIGGKKNYSLAKSLSYTEEELATVEKEWDFIYNYFKQNYLSEDQKIRSSFGSRGIKINNNLPGAIGYVIGYKIVESYVQIHGPNSWKDIYTIEREDLLKRSKFLK